MITVKVTASKQYSVLIGTDILPGLGSAVREIFPSAGKAALVTDTTVGPLYGDAAEASLRAAGFEVPRITIPAGEQFKTLATYGDVLAGLAGAHITRADLLVALGGGVTGDLGGFAAASYLRGIPFVQVPTTFLAAADASVGGKTAVDLPEGKNLVGAFHQPSLVYCDCGTFRTLPSGTFADGAAETIKHGLIADPAFFDFLLSHDMREEIEYVVRKNVEIKNTFVAADEFDRGRRQILNFGHTIGHTIEKNSDFTISHGRAVAIGMKASARAAYAFGLASEDLSGVISQALTRAGLDLACPFTPEQLTEAALHDKKRFDDTVNIIYLKKIGEPAIEPLPVAKLTDFLRAGLE